MVNTNQTTHEVIVDELVIVGSRYKDYSDDLNPYYSTGKALSSEELGSTCSYWGGTKSFIRNAHTILARYDEEDGAVMVKCWGDYRPMGRLVRPVIGK